MDQICKKEDCCGCKACRDICPKVAIDMIKTPNGFFYPIINQNLCIDCGLCKKVCPENEILRDITDHSLLFSAYSKNIDVRKSGSSGGIFYELACLWLNSYKNNATVYGAAFFPDLTLRHTGVTNVDNLTLLLKSKYIESDTNQVYVKIREELKAQRYILFCGTPCQCAALRKFLFNVDVSRLFVIDFLCHGVPSQDLFSKSINWLENKIGGKICKFEFRSKPIRKKRNNDHYFSYTYIKNGMEYQRNGLPNWKFPYYSGYCRYNSFRSSCYDCQYASPDRIGDITLGDFWRLDTVDNIDDLDKGYSMVFANTIRGKEIIKSISKDVNLREFPLEVAVRLNPTYTKGAVKTKENQQSVIALSRLPFIQYQKSYMLVRKDIFAKMWRLIARTINRLK